MAPQSPDASVRQQPNPHPVALQPFDQGVLFFVGPEHVHVPGQELIEVPGLDFEVVTPQDERARHEVSDLVVVGRWESSHRVLDDRVAQAAFEI